MFFVYLWYPKTKVLSLSHAPSTLWVFCTYDWYALSLQGTTYVYGTFFKPYISQHENEIDRNLLELRARATDTAVLYFQKAASAGQNTFFDVLKYIASQSPSQKSRQRPHQVCTIMLSVKFGHWINICFPRLRKLNIVIFTQIVKDIFCSSLNQIGQCCYTSFPATLCIC